MHVNRKKTLWIAASLLFATLLPSIMVHPASAAGQSPTTLLVPLYGYPSGAWNTLAQQKQANPSVPIVAIINPNSGPGTYADPNFVTGIQTLRSAGVTVMGYTYTHYASRPLAAVESDILAYSHLYGVTGIYLDEMSNVPGTESYYSTITQYAHSIGTNLVIGNPGADVPSSFIGTVDSIVIYESPGLPSLSFLGGWHSSYPKADFGIVAYGVSWLDSSYITSASSSLGYLYVTDGGWPNPFINPPTFLSTLLGDLSQAQSVASPQSGNGGAVTVEAVDSGGNALTGYYTTLWQNGAQLQSCFSPCSFTVNNGGSYQVAISGYANEAFAHWSDGTSNQFHDIAVPANGGTVSLTAVLNP